MSDASRPGSIVSAFYEAVRVQDPDAIRTLVRERFADDVAFHWPSSLPYGGTMAGKAKLERVLAGAATARAGVQGLRLVDLVDGGEQIAAVVEFDWHSPGGQVVVGTGAVEVWSFSEDRVQDVSAYYWDTAACVAASS
ncbi:nuclear transport factor 2 family protein [Streptomyces sp. NPDC058001]|uniref:nuclear transport factor 2 family protein n=1 Tax=Streptomyces sp. NPDC058001 TaxID=3346300 RepID=UPI0036E7AC27